MREIYQVEGTVEKDAEGNVTRLEWVDVPKEEAIRAWDEFGLLVRTVYVKDEGDVLPVDTLAKAVQNAPLSPSDNQGAGVRALKGFVLMPSDPTPEMLEEICLTEGFTEKALRARYAALIAAGQKAVQDGD